MIVVSYGTQDGTYDKALYRLRDTQDQHGFDHDLHVIPPDTRELICRRKPSFLLSMLEKHNQPIVWIDADAVVTRSFSLPTGNWDLGFIPNTLRNRRHVYPVASFVVAVQPTEASRSFLRTWNHLCQWQESPKGDHHRLHPARLLQRKEYVEMDLVKPLRRAIIRDLGGHKENTVETDFDFYWSRIVRRLTGQRGQRLQIQ